MTRRLALKKKTKKPVRMQCPKCGAFLWATVSAEGVRIWCTEHGVLFHYYVVYPPVDEDGMAAPEVSEPAPPRRLPPGD